MEYFCYAIVAFISVGLQRDRYSPIAQQLSLFVKPLHGNGCFVIAYFAVVV
jgi:hypothetical protein